MDRDQFNQIVDIHEKFLIVVKDLAQTAKSLDDKLRILNKQTIPDNKQKTSAA